MKHIAILRFAPHDGPGYFATYLSRERLPWRVVKIDEGEPLPRLDELAGLAMMGGAMSVNDDLAWIAPTLDLVRKSVESNVPVIGHCLGGQMLSKALGGSVTRNHVKEIGWGEVSVVDGETGGQWGPTSPFLSYHWHGETFSLPRDAVRIWSSAHCANQAFVLGPHFGMQCHIEMTKAMIDAWCETGADEIEESIAGSPAVQRPEEMRIRAEEKLQALNAVADRVYSRWTQGLKAG